MSSTTIKPKLNLLTHLGLELIAVIDSGNCPSIEISDIYTNLEERSLIVFLIQRLPDSLDMSHLLEKPDQVKAINEVLWQTAGGIKGNELRKLGVRTNGLFYLLSLILCVIQQHDWTDAKDDSIGIY